MELRDTSAAQELGIIEMVSTGEGSLQDEGRTGFQQQEHPISRHFGFIDKARSRSRWWSPSAFEDMLPAGGSVRESRDLKRPSFQAGIMGKDYIESGTTFPSRVDGIRGLPSGGSVMDRLG